MSDVDEQAGQYLSAGNAVTGFYVAQTILFLNSIHISQVLLSTLLESKFKAIAVTVSIAAVYATTIALCGCIERQLRFISYKDNENQKAILSICRRATWGRIAVVILLCAGCVAAIWDLEKPGEAQVEAVCK